MIRRLEEKGSITYEIVGEECVRIHEFNHDLVNCIIGSDVTLQDGLKYKIIGFSIHDEKSIISASATKIKIKKTSSIDLIPTFFIYSCNLFIISNQNTKRIKCDFSRNIKVPMIDVTNINKFISNNSRYLMNNHPLELVIYKSKTSNIMFRETVKIIGISLFKLNTFIIHVIIPSSVEIIGKNAFLYCKKLRSIYIKGNSHLRIIGDAAFSRTAIQKFICPSSVEFIEDYVFNGVEKLSSIIFLKDSKLKKIGFNAFFNTIIERIEFPASLEEIDDEAFTPCEELFSIQFQENSKLKYIGVAAFCNTIIERIEFPVSLEEIDDEAFISCEKLSSIQFQEISKLRKIGKNAFRNTNIGEIEFPASVEDSAGITSK